MTCDSCGKQGGISYDYDGGRVLVERKIDFNYSQEVQPPDQVYSIYAYGATGLLQRTVGDGVGQPCPDCTWYYLSDATGNCVGVSKRAASGESLADVEFTRMDAWGNLLTARDDPPTQPLATTQPVCSTRPSCTGSEAYPNMQAATGPYQYRGQEGYETDVVDINRGQSKPGARSTGFMHVGCRYYEPATGRFLQYDPMEVDPGALMRGQQNRWTYCANDPVNASDPSGMLLGTFLGATMIAMGLFFMMSAITEIGGMVSSPFFFLALTAATGATVAALGAALAEFLFGLALIAIGASWLAGDNGFPCQAAILGDIGAGLLALSGASGMAGASSDKDFLKNLARLLGGVAKFFLN